MLSLALTESDTASLSVFVWSAGCVIVIGLPTFHVNVVLAL